MGQVPATSEGAHRILMATDWEEIFKQRPDLSPPGYEKAVEDALHSWQEKKEREQCRKPSRRGRNDGR